MIPKRWLGSTGFEVGVLGLGTVKLGRNTGVKYPEGFSLPTDEEARELIARARDLGINLLDTAPAYGSSEQRLGALLRGSRDDWVIVTKAGENFADGVSSFDFSASAIRKSVERSLTRLQTDRVECVLLHSDGRDLWILEQSGAMEELVRLKEEGKVLSVGISTKTPEGACKAVAICDVIMATLNLNEQADLPAILEAQREGVGVLVKKALASGHSADPGASLGFVLGRPEVACAVVGTIDPIHLEQNARVAQSSVGT